MIAEAPVLFNLSAEPQFKPIQRVARLRTGTSEARYGVVPDIVVAAKGITSGYLPLGATIISDRLYDGLARARTDGALLAHGFTYSGHAAACAVALANIELMERERICDRVREIGPFFHERLQTLKGHPIVGDVRGSHFMLCLELVQDRHTKTPFPVEIEIGKLVAREAQSRGLIIRPIGNLSVLSPTLILTREQIDLIVETLHESLRAVLDDLTRRGVEFVD